MIRLTTLVLSVLCVAACNGDEELDLSRPLQTQRTCTALPADAAVAALPAFDPALAKNGGQFRTELDAAGNAVPIGPVQLEPAAGDLEIFSLDPVVVGGSLLFAAPAAGAPSIRIISKRFVEIRAGATVGAASNDDRSRAPAGKAGGEVMISGTTISSAGTVRAMPGGNGASATRPDGPAANPDAGAGAAGGEVVLCADDGIQLNPAASRVEGGHGGGAGALSWTRATIGMNADNTSRGGRGGDIHLIARAGGNPEAQGSGTLVGGAGGSGGDATAVVSNTTAAETEAKAKASGGGRGGVVRFSAMLIGKPAATAPTLTRGDGGGGGAAKAVGAAGRNAVAPPANANGKRGTHATARGGDGAAAKPFRYPLIDATGQVVVVQSLAGMQGRGGAASAAAGAGGNGAGGGQGASSGKAAAQAGTNGAGTAGQANDRPRQPPNGANGGAGGAATAPVNP